MQGSLQKMGIWIHCVTEMPVEDISGSPLEAELLPVTALPGQILKTPKDSGSTVSLYFP